MKRLIKIVLSATFIFILFGFMQYDSVKKIKEKYTEIDSSLENYEKVLNNDINAYKDINPTKYSNESVEVYSLAIINMERFYENGILNKAVVKFSGDRQDLLSEYYYDNDRVFFIHKAMTYFKKPKWSENFNPDKKSVYITKFYLVNEKLIKLERSDTTFKLEDNFEKKIEPKLLEDANLYKEFEK